MKNTLFAILMLFISIAHTTSYTPMCPDWSSSVAYTIGDCVSDEGTNYMLLWM